MAIVLKKKKKAIGAVTGFRRRAAEVTLLRPGWVPKTPPCTFACPNGNEIRACLTTIAQTESSDATLEEVMEKAWYTLVNTNPFPSVCGQVCPHPCETDCNRNEKDEAVNISAVEWAIGEYGVKHSLSHRKIRDESYPEKVAVIGSGPSGLSYAYQLARRGYPVTVFEAFDKAGGMLQYGIPDYRLRKDILDAEIKAILGLGIDIKYNTRVGVDITFEELRKQFKAIYVAIGGHVGVRLGVPGEDMPNVFTGAAFLNKVNSGEKVDVGNKVIVVGGGNSAIDAARVAKRLGADVAIHYRRTRKEMPAIEHEIAGAEEEGIHFEFLTAPVEVLRDGNRATGIKSIRMKLGEPDASGRPRPIPVEGSEFDVDASTIIASIRQQPDFSGLEQIKDEEGWISVDERSQTSIPGVFAGGDVTNQLGLVAEAIGLGRKAAESIDAYLRGREPEKVTLPPVIRAEKMKLEYYKTLPRNEAQALTVGERVNNFSPVTSLLTESQVKDEPLRCMSCGMCFSCDVCFSYCQDNAVKRAPEGSEYKYYFELSFCTGCKKCAEECPCGFIDMA